MAGKPASSKKKKTAIVLVVVLIIAVLVGIIIFLLLRKPAGADAEPQPEPLGQRNVVITDENVQEMMERMAAEGPVEQGYYSVNMSNRWHFTDGKSASDDAYVANDASNTNDVYFDVFLESDESKPILQSPVIPLGGHLENITLDEPLEAGTYDCVLIYHLVDDEQNTLSTLRVGLTINVDN